MAIISCMVPEISSVTENFLSFWNHVLPFYPPNNPKNQKFEKMKKPPGDIITLHMCTINDNDIMYGSWDIERNTEFFVILDHFCLYPCNNPKNQNFEKMKKIPGDIILSHKCTINDNHMMYGFWNWKRDTEFFVILDCFLPFYRCNSPKNQNLKKWKKYYRYNRYIIILCVCNINDNHMMYGSWDMERDTEFFVILDHFLHFYPPNNPKN